jgi:CheY-like chemotaxis protein
MLIIFDLRREKATGYDLSFCRFMLQRAVGRNEPQEMSQPTVLVVDDSEDTCRMLAKLIRRLGAPADCITSGEAALKWMTDHMPRLVILDMMMPGMDGMTVLHAIRADDRLKEVAVVMFSAVSDPAFRDYAISEGANDYWVKSSIDFSKLPVYLKPYLERGTMHG